MKESFNVSNDQTTINLNSIIDIYAMITVRRQRRHLVNASKEEYSSANRYRRNECINLFAVARCTQCHTMSCQCHTLHRV